MPNLLFETDNKRFHSKIARNYKKVFIKRQHPVFNMYSIITSTKDPAGMNIKNCLLEKGFAETSEEQFGHKVYEKDRTKLYTTDQESIYADNIDKEMEGEKIIFATRHRSTSGKKTLSVHVSGNWGKAEAGGKDKQLCVAMPGEMKKALNLMKKKVQEETEGKRRLEEYDVSMECTHHGPYIEKPCMWIEIGSEKESWQNKEAGKLIAEVIIEILDKEKEKDVQESESVIVLGGGHYNQTANKIMTRTRYSVGHICPKYHLNELDEELIIQAMKKNPGFSRFILDWKGMGTEKRNVVDLLEKTGIKYERYKNFMKKEEAEESNQKKLQ